MLREVTADGITAIGDLAHTLPFVTMRDRAVSVAEMAVQAQRYLVPKNGELGAVAPVMLEPEPEYEGGVVNPPITPAGCEVRELDAAFMESYWRSVRRATKAYSRPGRRLSYVPSRVPCRPLARASLVGMRPNARRRASTTSSGSDPPDPADPHDLARHRGRVSAPGGRP